MRSARGCITPPPQGMRWLTQAARAPSPARPCQATVFCSCVSSLVRGGTWRCGDRRVRKWKRPAAARLTQKYPSRHARAGNIFALITRALDISLVGRQPMCTISLKLLRAGKYVAGVSFFRATFAILLYKLEWIYLRKQTFIKSGRSILNMNLTISKKYLSRNSKSKYRW